MLLLRVSGPDGLTLGVVLGIFDFSWLFFFWVFLVLDYRSVYLYLSLIYLSFVVH